MCAKNSGMEKFSDCVNSILERRGMNASQLTALLGHKSKTTVLRILQGTAGLRSMGGFCRELCGCGALRLTEAEAERLRVAYEVEMWGADNYRARAEMWQLLRKSSIQEPPMQLLYGDDGITTLDGFFDSFVPAEEDGSAGVAEMEILMLSGCYATVMLSVARLLYRMKTKLHVRQLFMVNNDMARTVRMVRNILPTVGYHTYEAHLVSQKQIAPDPIYSGSGTGKAMTLRVVTADGTEREFQILMQSETMAVMLEAPGLWRQWQKFTDIYLTHSEPLKAQVPDIRDYASMLKYYADTERNREMLVYKAGVCFYHIPTEILFHALTDAIQQSENIQTTEDIRQMLPKLRSLQEKRFQNMVNKRQPTHWVASRRALRLFAATGEQEDHFFAMRPFTGEERHRIFRHLLDMAENNPYFHLYLMRDEDEDSFVDLEAACFVGRGLQLTSVGTNYCLEDGWTETLLEEEGFCDLYREFFMQELIAHHTSPPEDTIVLLREILRDLETEMEQTAK